jgi:hypothetical protein
MINNFKDNFSKGLILASKDKYLELCNFLSNYYERNKQGNWSFVKTEDLMIYDLGEKGAIQLINKHNFISWKNDVPKILVDCLEKICEFPLC